MQAGEGTRTNPIFGFSAQGDGNEVRMRTNVPTDNGHSAQVHICIGHFTVSHIYPGLALSTLARRRVSKPPGPEGCKARTKGSGLFPRISSICARCSSVIFGSTFSASRFSSSCSAEETPRMMVEVLGFFASHASASAVGVELRSMVGKILVSH